MDVRQEIVNAIQPLLPKKWNYVPNQSTPQTINAPTVLVWLETVERIKEGPQSGLYLVTYMIRILQPQTTPGKADAALDMDLFALLEALDNSGARWGNPVERIVWDEKYPGYQIPVVSIVHPE